MAQPELLFSHRPFDEKVVEKLLGDKLSNYEYAEVPHDECKLRGLVLSHVANNKDKSNKKSYAVHQKNKDEDAIAQNDNKGNDPLHQEGCDRTKVKAGLGFFHVNDDILVLHQSVGEPCGTHIDVKQKHSIVLFCATAKGGIQTIQAFCTQLITESERADPNRYSIFRFHLQYRFWQHDSRAPARPIESVVLPAADKDRVLKDVEDFLSSETQAFYLRHGIPYRRSLLFHGKPGTGKSSLIAGLASKFLRNVCYLTLCHRDMSDDVLRDAINRVPSRSIIVLEDIDSLFNKNRGKKNDTPLTFSGLLNALDGIGSSTGQLFVMTTNEVHNLDAALVRPGRVDLSVEFKSCLPEQARSMFALFYPDVPDSYAQTFTENLFEQLGDDETLSTAALQSYFVKHRSSDAIEARDSTSTLIANMKERAKHDAVDGGRGDPPPGTAKLRSGVVDHQKKNWYLLMIPSKETLQNVGFGVLLASVCFQHVCRKGK